MAATSTVLAIPVAALDSPLIILLALVEATLVEVKTPMVAENSTGPEIPVAVLDSPPITPLAPLVEASLAEVETPMVTENSMVPEIPVAAMDSPPTTPLAPPVEAYLAENSMVPETLAAVLEDRPTTRPVPPAEACPDVMMTPMEVEGTHMALAVNRLGVPTTMTSLETPRAEVRHDFYLSMSFRKYGQD